MRDLKEIRLEIDKTDGAILGLLEKRLRLAKKMGEVKRERGMQIHDPAREAEILSEVSSKTSLDQRFVKKIFQMVIEYCRENE